jgi:hypothetical protein
MVERRVITAEEMDLMSPQDRDLAVRQGELRTLTDLPLDLQQRVVARALKIENQLRPTQ